MGYYINPGNMTKEQWLKDNAVGEYSNDPPEEGYRKGDNVAVCWIHNGAFTAAGIAFDPGEFQAFIDGRGGRHWHWFYIPIESIYKLHPHFRGIVK